MHAEGKNRAIADSDLVEMRRVESFRVCPACLVASSAQDAFCTACGALLPNAPAAVLTPSRHPGLARRHWVVVAGVFVLFVCGVAGTASFAWLWHKERAHDRRLTVELATTRRRLGEAQAELRSTQASLRAATSLASKRKSVLQRAQTVLAKVDPLLSSVDELQQDTGAIQSERDAFTTASETLINDSIALANYLIQTDPSIIDPSYEQQLIDTANADLATVQADHAALGSSDSSYTGASDRFGTRADAFTNAVRKLQQQLRAASK